MYLFVRLFVFFVAPLHKKAIREHMPRPNVLGVRPKNGCLISRDPLRAATPYVFTLEVDFCTIKRSETFEVPRRVCARI